MHYKDGIKASVGDIVIHIDTHKEGNEKIMIVQSIMPGAETCNSNMIPLAIRQKGTDHWFPWNNQIQAFVSLKECYKIQELGDPKQKAVPELVST